MSIGIWNALFGLLLSAAPGHSVQGDFCHTEVCKISGQKMFSAINHSADPCEDFFEYACRRWIATHPIPDNATESSNAKELKKHMKLVIQDEIEKLGAKPVLNFLTEQLGGWPVLSPDWNASNFDLFTALVKLRLYGDQPFFTVSAGEDFAIPSNNMIYLGEPGTFAKRDVLESEQGASVTASYLALITNVTGLIMKEIGDRRDVIAVAGELKDLLDLGRFLSLSGQTTIEKRDVHAFKNKTTLGANQAKTFTRSAFFRNMTGYLQAIFEPVGLSHLINSHTPILVRTAPFFDRVDGKLLELERLKVFGKRRLANYIGWKVIARYIEQLSKPYRDEWAKHWQRIEGKVVAHEKPATERCATDVTSSMPWAVDAVYVRDFVPKDLKEQAAVMVDDMKLGFREMLHEATWMDRQTSDAALRKLDAMLTVIAYPNVLSSNISIFDKMYENITIGRTYLETNLNIAKDLTYKSLRHLLDKNVRDDPLQDTVEVMTVNAYNKLSKNLVVVLAGILQYPFFVAGNPQYLNYGGNGVAHEITHGFDDQGSSFDEEGRMRSWWSSASKKAYDRKKKTLINQYSAFALANGHVNGELTLGENIADNGGLKTAYRAYFNHFRKRLYRPEPLLSALPNTTVEQLFFLSAGQVWCGTTRTEQERLEVLTSVHPPYKYRVIGPMSNMPEFSRAFNCPIGSRMNPAVKAALWGGASSLSHEVSAFIITTTLVLNIVLL
ncbi:Endothelin-converting enzyme 1 [Hypsibius exemplaris]|uniref:Endothelin-converting enzyme 1 n=1 Tax=Hypsibius exemplaris TaxID=2072580 RepID=A0A9X6NDE8_HYPEX|nr:Endothelin-converting enzyme 1 [Hypsibius exemplaris]